MSKKTAENGPEKKRAKEIRNGLLLAHVVVSWVVVIAVRFKWWSVIVHGAEDPSLAFFGSDPKAYQTGYITLAAIVAFFFTSYDIVANSDIQWPPLLASAFALGCAAEVTWKAFNDSDTVMQHIVALQMERDYTKEATAPVASSSASGPVAGVSSGSTAAVGSASAAAKEPAIRFRIAWGLQLALYGTFCMVLLSSWLTFFAKREGVP